MPSNGQLRTYQVLVFIVSGTAGLVVSISVGWTSNILRGECVLYSNMALSRLLNGSLVLRPDTSKWGTPAECSFCTFCPVGVTIYCIIWIWFYIFLSDWGTSFIEEKPLLPDDFGDRPPPDQHLLIPSIVCNTLVLGLLLSTVAIVEAGHMEWCDNIEKSLNGKACSSVGHAVWLNVKNGENIYQYLTHARISCWVLLFSMVFQTVIIFVRLRRNSQRPRLDSTVSEPFSDVVSEHTGEPLSEPFSDSELTTEDRPPARRRLQRQKKVVIDLGEHDDDVTMTSPNNNMATVDIHMEEPT